MDTGKPQGEQPRHDEEPNPLIAFRRHVDAQVNSLLGSVISLPSTIYNRGQDHSRMWARHRQERLRAMDEEERERARSGDKQWEDAMRDFEESEREVKEWYDTVLKQITQRRDEHLESGMGFGSVESGSQDVNACPYLPPTEDRAKQSPVTSREGKAECKRSSSWTCEREYPQSRFLDWVWTGWGGPSTSPDLLWHRAHKQEDRSSAASALGMPSKDVSLSQSVPVNPPNSSLTQQTVSERLVPAADDAATTSSSSPSGRLPLLFFLLLDRDSPLHLEKDPELGMFGTQWRDAYEDLIRAQADRPMITAEESADNETRSPNEWLKQVLESYGLDVAGANAESKHPASIPKTMPDNMKDFQNAWSNLRAQLFGEAFEGEGSYPDAPVRASQGNDFASSPLTETTSGGTDDNDDGPHHELDFYLNRTTGNAATMSPLGKMHHPSEPVSVQESTSQQTNADGTRSSTHVLVETFDGGQQRTTERTSRWDADGNVIRDETKTYTQNIPSPAANTVDPFAEWARSVREEDEECAFGVERRPRMWQHTGRDLTMPKSRDEFERLVNQRFREARAQQNEDKQKQQDGDMRVGSGWFWRN